MRFDYFCRYLRLYSHKCYYLFSIFQILFFFFLPLKISLNLPESLHLEGRDWKWKPPLHVTGVCCQGRRWRGSPSVAHGTGAYKKPCSRNHPSPCCFLFFIFFLVFYRQVGPIKHLTNPAGVFLLALGGFGSGPLWPTVGQAPTVPDIRCRGAGQLHWVHTNCCMKYPCKNIY